MSEATKTGASDRTIAHFGEQWTNFRDNEGYYGSAALFADMCAPLIVPDEVRGRRVADIGSGTGRIVRMLVAAGAAHVVAVEPSAAYEVLCRNVADIGERVECVRATGDQLPRDRQFDLITSIGVLHHIPDPYPSCERRTKRCGREGASSCGCTGVKATAPISLSPDRSVP